MSSETELKEAVPAASQSEIPVGEADGRESEEAPSTTKLAASSSRTSQMDDIPMSPSSLTSPTYYDDFAGDFIVYNRMPLKEICLALALLTLGTLGIVVGSYMAYHKVWGDRTHGLIFVFLGVLTFFPGFHETRVAYFAYIGYKGFHFSSIPAV